MIALLLPSWLTRRKKPSYVLTVNMTHLANPSPRLTYMALHKAK